MLLLRYLLVSEKNHELFTITFFGRNDFDICLGFSLASNYRPDRVRLLCNIRFSSLYIIIIYIILYNYKFYSKNNNNLYNLYSYNSQKSYSYRFELHAISKRRNFWILCRAFPIFFT